jgi:peroxiredoxin
MNNKIAPGQQIPRLSVRNIHGAELFIPEAGRWTHLQFRRFAGCPVCNLHLQSFVARHRELADRGVREVVTFHSSDAELLPYQGQFPFEVIGDPNKTLYRRFGVESSIWAVLDPRAWGASLRGNLRKGKPALNGMPNGGILGLPADFLIAPDGTVEAVHYGTHAYDQWSVDEVLAKASGRTI